MKILLQIIVTVLFFTTDVIRSKEVNQTLVDYYIEYINKHTEKAMKYKPPKDARMYEAKNKHPIGKCSFF